MPNLIKERRAELKLTQQEAARRADVSLATWRRFENATGDGNTLDGFRADNVQGFARALKLGVGALHQMAATASEDAVAPSDDDGPAVVDRRTVDIVRLFNRSFTGDPLTPVDAMALAQTVTFSDFAPTQDGRFHVDSSFGYQFAAYLKGEATIRDVDLLCDLPELALTQVTNHWLVRMGERIMRIGSELDAGRVPRPVCLADEYALWIVIKNTDPPQLGDVLDIFPGLHDAQDVFGYDPDFDEPDDPAGPEEWMNRMAGGLLPPSDSHDHRRYDLEIMEAYGQGIYDLTDLRHPVHWFDRDDLRARCESELAFVRLSKEEQDAPTAEVLNRMSQNLFPHTTDQSDQL